MKIRFDLGFSISPPHKINELAISPDDHLIATCGIDSTIKLWTIDGELVQTIVGHTGVVNDVNFTPNGRYVVSASSDSTVRVWSLVGREIWKYDDFREPFFQAIVANDGLSIIAASDRSIVSFDALDWADVAKPQAATRPELTALRTERGITLRHSLGDERPLLVEIYDLLGRELYRGEHRSIGGEVFISDAPKGHGLVIRLTSGDCSATTIVP